MATWSDIWKLKLTEAQRVAAIKAAAFTPPTIKSRKGGLNPSRGGQKGRPSR